MTARPLRMVALALAVAMVACAVMLVVGAAISWFTIPHRALEEPAE